MQSLNVINSKYIKRVFDIKGSSVDRFTKDIVNKDKLHALKDKDFLWMKAVYDEVRILY